MYNDLPTYSPMKVITVACSRLSFMKNALTLLGPMSRTIPAIIPICDKH